MPDDIDILTFGCRLNIWESEVMRRLAREAGMDKAVIVNTCAVTAAAEKDARQAIRRAKRAHPDRQIIVTGCAAQLRAADFAAMPEVARVLGNADKLRPESWQAAAPRHLISDVMAVRETAAHLLDGFDGHARAFVQVQQGCDHRCTFCVIPFARGPSRSVALAAVIDGVARLVDNGYREVVLTGVDLTAWGDDLAGSLRLGDLVAAVLRDVPDLERLRLSSLDPCEIDAALWAVLATETRLMPHLHLSVQAGDDLILKRMKRRHARADVIGVAEQARQLRPDIVLGADLIAGFPTEDEVAFANTLRLIEEARLTWLHVFPYSARPGTPAARMPLVQGDRIRTRAARLREAGEVAAARFLASRIGTQARIVGERGGVGRTEHYAPVRPDRPIPVGETARVRLARVEDGVLVGEVL
jgi:threonylcarbamoyladenosine tRNA methylthiotransferase MtaB